MCIYKKRRYQFLSTELTAAGAAILRLLELHISRQIMS